MARRQGFWEARVRIVQEIRSFGNADAEGEQMKTSKLLLSVFMLLAVSLSCKFLDRTGSKEVSDAQAIDFSAPGKSRNVTVQLDKKKATTKVIPRSGGSLSLTSADGSIFTLDVPAEALDAETEITMTAVKSLDGAPLDNNTPTAVQLEPSGLFFKDMATLTIVPAIEIPIKQQIVFGYEGDGQDYHLAPVDPRSKEIKVKLMGFSGAGVGSGGDAAWAANLMNQAGTAAARISQKLGEYLQRQRQHTLLSGDEDLDNTELAKQIKSAMDQYEDEVIRKEMVAAELDCKHAPEAMQAILGLNRQKQLLGFEPDPETWAKIDKLAKIAENCTWPYRIVGGLDDFQTNTTVCNIMKPFTLSGGGITLQASGGLRGTYTYTGIFNAMGSGTYTISLPQGLGKPGTMTGGGEGSAAGHTGSGTEKYTLTPIEPCN